MSNVTEHLLDETRRLVSNTEDLLKATAGDVGEHAEAARAKLEPKLRRIKGQLLDLEYELERKAKNAARDVDAYAHDNPWTVAGAGILVGLLIGLLVSRRD
ncbi:MAG: DUF883 family protein [Burkholderiales bacterium]|jgi:ElaB/YqjD/DUF883 family membrane-anchored ribosome-binding protein|nr:DUF883 family protein [Burkholderiales bacterium]